MRFACTILLIHLVFTSTLTADYTKSKNFISAGLNLGIAQDGEQFSPFTGGEISYFRIFPEFRDMFLGAFIDIVHLSKTNETRTNFGPEIGMPLGKSNLLIGLDGGLVLSNREKEVAYSLRPFIAFYSFMLFYRATGLRDGGVYDVGILLKVPIPLGE